MRASVRAEYGIGVRDVGVLELADLVAWLPKGSAFWQSYGGPNARSDEVEALLLVDFRLRQQMYVNGGRRGPEPEFPKPPPLAADRRAGEAQMARKAAARERRLARMKPEG